MSDDPYDNMPSLEDLEESGATGWFSDALEQQKKRNASLKAALGTETDSLKSERDELRSILENPPESKEGQDEPVLDLFAAEREAAAKAKNPFASLTEDLKASKSQDKKLLDDLFGS